MAQVFWAEPGLWGLGLPVLAPPSVAMSPGRRKNLRFLLCELGMLGPCLRDGWYWGPRHQSGPCPVLVSSGGRNKMPQIGGLENTDLFLTALEAGTFATRAVAGWGPVPGL